MRQPNKKRSSKPAKKRAAVQDPKYPMIVGIGGSAGALAGICTLTSQLNTDSDFAYIVVQHLGPQEPSRFVEIIAKSSILPVKIIKNGMALSANEVYVVPPGAAVDFERGKMVLAMKANKQRQIDIVFKNIAKAVGPKAIGVILSGSLSDGTEGVRAIKLVGGRTIAQDPATAAFDGMPRSAIASGCVDFVFGGETIGVELGRLPYAPPSPDRIKHPEVNDSQDPIDLILSLLRNENLGDLTEYKRASVQRRIERQMALKKISSPKEFSRYLLDNPNSLKALYDDMFVHVTEFFRDPSSFKVMQEKVFPELIEDRSAVDPIRIWVPGCSSGEEPYSIAIALTEFLESVKSKVSFQIFATDINDRAIQIARRGTYAASSLDGIGSQRLGRFFEPVKEGFKIRKDIRESCVFSKHDIVNHPPFAKMDMISFRNVLIYFTATLQRRVFAVLFYALKPNGFLCLGGAESLGSFAKNFIEADKGAKIFVKNGSAPPPEIPLPMSRVPFGLPTLERAAANSGIDFQKSADQMVLYKYGPPGVIVDHRFDIVQFRGRTAPFLEPPPGMPNSHLYKMIHSDLLPAVRMLVQSAKKENTSVRRENVKMSINGQNRNVNLEVTPINPVAPENQRLYLILFEDSKAAINKSSARGSTERRTRSQLTSTDSKDQYIEQLLHELESLREYHKSLSEQFESTQEELTSANEELQSMNEELQSTNEELKTTNDELQKRHHELSAAYERMQRDETKFRLMISGVKDYAIFMLDTEGRVATWNEGAKRIKGYEASEIIGQHFSRFYPPEDIVTGKPQRELEIVDHEGRVEDEGWRVRKDGTRFWGNVIITRVNDSSGHHIGYSKVTRDMTEIKRAQEALARAEGRFRMVVNSIRDYSIFMLDSHGNVVTWNEGAKRISGYEEQEIVGRHFSILYSLEDRAGRVEKELEIASRTGRYEEESWRMRKDGSRYWASVVLTSILESGKLVGFANVTRDLTERKGAEDQIRETNASLERRVHERTAELEHIQKQLQQAVSLRDEFLSISSHELKTPLTSLKLQLQLAQRRSAMSGGQLDADTLQSVLKMSLRQVNSLSDLVEDLLDLSRIRSGKFTLSREAVDLSELARDMLHRFEEQFQAAKMRIEADLAPEAVGHWDRRRLEQVVSNLFANATKYAPRSLLKIRTMVENGRGVLTIEDSGPGIAEERQKRIFEPFERAEAPEHIGGLGLGLYISRRIIEAHNGVLTLTSEPGKGSKFRIELPMN